MEQVAPNAAQQQVDEKALLVARAKQLGIPHSPNIGVDTLRQKIDDYLNDRPDSTEPATTVTTIQVPATETKDQRDSRLRQEIQKEQLKLVRIRITNMDPSKTELRGEVLSVQNKYVGTVRKFIPYGEAAEFGYHVPWIMYQMLLEKKFNQVKTRKSPDVRGEIIVEQRMVREFAIELLPPLTPQELADLKTAQAAKGIGQDGL